MDAMTIIVGVAFVGCRGSSSSSIPATERSVKFGGVDAHDDDEVSIIVDQLLCTKRWKVAARVKFKILHTVAGERGALMMMSPNFGSRSAPDNPTERKIQKE